MTGFFSLFPFPRSLVSWNGDTSRIFLLLGPLIATAAAVIVILVEVAGTTTRGVLAVATFAGFVVAAEFVCTEGPATALGGFVGGGFGWLARKS